MRYLSAHFASHQSAMAAMQMFTGRGLGRVRLQPLTERHAEPGDTPVDSADPGRCRLEIMLSDSATEDQIEAMLGPFGATDMVRTSATGTPFPDHDPARDGAS